MPRAHITPYAISYTFWYIALTVLVALLFALLQWPGGVGTILLIAFGASWHAGRKFALQEGCHPYPDGGFRVVVNTGTHGGQEVHHLHVHVMGGPRPWARG